MKRIAVLTLVLALALSPPSLAAEGMGYSDVAGEDWFAPYVGVCDREGLMEGTGEGRFEPEGIVSMDEALVLAGRVFWLADGGTGALPKGGSVEEFISLVHESHPLSDPPHEGQRKVYEELSQSWAWDGIFYLTRRFREELGGQSTTYYDRSSAAPREAFFSLLSVAGQGLGLEPLNEVEALPDCEDPGILTLYWAGILTGTDEFGSFSGARTLTRSEAAAVLARLVRPELRTAFSPAPLPTQGYTLTYLMDGVMGIGVDYPVCGWYAAEGQESGFVTLEGKQLPWPGVVPSFGLERDGEYDYFAAWNENTEDNPYDTKKGLMDRDGTYAVPMGDYDRLYSTDDGHFLRVEIADPLASPSRSRWFLLSADGTVEAELPETIGTPENNWRGFNEGVCPWKDEVSGLTGYVDRTGAWAVAPTWRSATSFYRGYAAVENVDGLIGLIDRSGRLVLPYQYRELQHGHVSPGSDAPLLYQFADQDGRKGWIQPDGTEVSGPLVSRYQNGYFTQSGIYYDLDGRPASQKFDAAGPLNAEGAGFVELGEKIYRIQFQP